MKVQYPFCHWSSLNTLYLGFFWLWQQCIIRGVRCSYYSFCLQNFIFPQEWTHSTKGWGTSLSFKVYMSHHFHILSVNDSCWSWWLIAWFRTLYPDGFFFHFKSWFILQFKSNNLEPKNLEPCLCCLLMLLFYLYPLDSLVQSVCLSIWLTYPILFSSTDKDLLVVLKP